MDTTRDTLLRRRTFLAATLAAAASASTACGFGGDSGGSEGSGGNSGDDGSGGGGTLRQSMIPVTHLDPAIRGNASYGQILMVGLWEGLVVIDVEEPTQVAPGVAESWDISEDGLTYTFHLRSDAKWSNGDPVTAGDFEWNWRRILTPGIAGEDNPSYDPIEVGVTGAMAYMTGETDNFDEVGVAAPDDGTFELTLDTPNADLLLLLAGYWALPLHPATVEEHGDGWFDPANWVSNGPYVLDDFRVNQGAVLLPNEQYWDRDSYHISRWEVTFNDAGTTADLLAYQQNEIHITGRIEDDLEAVTTSDVAGELVTSPTNQIRRLTVMNSRNPALHDVRVRQALALAIDRQALGEVGHPAISGPSLVPEAVPDHDQLPPIEFDPDGAAALLEEAGYPGGQGMPTITLLDFQQSPWVEAIAQMWRENLGIDVSLDIVEIGVYSDKRELLHPEGYTGFYVQNVAVNPPTFLAFNKSAIPNSPHIKAANLTPPDVASDFLKAQENGASPAELFDILEGNREPEIQSAIDMAREAVAAEDPDAQHDLLIEAAIAFAETYISIPVLWGGYNLLVKPTVQNLRPWMHSSVFTTKGVTLEG